MSKAYVGCADDGDGFDIVRPKGSVSEGEEKDDTEEKRKSCDDERAGEYGMRETKNIKDPKKPSVEESEEHSKTHLPYRGWCRHCVRWRGRALPQRVGENHYDFALLGKEGEPGCMMPVMVAS